MISGEFSLLEYYKKIIIFKFLTFLMATALCSCSGVGSGGGNTPLAINGGPNAANPTDGTLNPLGDESTVDREGKNFAALYQCSPAPDYSQPLDKNPEATDAPTLTLAPDGSLDLKLLIQKYVVVSILKGISTPMWVAASSYLKDTYVRVIFQPSGQPSSEYKYRDFAITEDPKPEGYNVFFHFLSGHLGEGELSIYVKNTYKPAHYSEDHLSSFPQDPNETGTYEKFTHNAYVTYVGRFKIAKTAE